MTTDKIARYVWIGRKDQFWYHEAEAVFTELFGRDRLDLVTKLFAATSINTSLKSNITLFRRALHEIERDLPIGRYMPNIKQQLEQIRKGEELTGRKIRSFARAMAGDPDAVVVDIWLLRAFDMDRKYFRNDKIQPGNELDEYIEEHGAQMPIEGEIGSEFTRTILRPETTEPKKRGRFRSGGASDGQYTKIETYVRNEARAMGIQPRMLSAMIWSGVRIDQSGDTETRYTNILRSKFINLFNAPTDVLL
jgi:hypothetical protein